MRRTRSAPAANKAEQARWSLMREIGCIACLLNEHRPDLHFDRTGMELEHQHMTDGGRRQGHTQSFELCRFHHQGDKFPMIEAGYRANALRYGPSFGKGRRPFAAVYGDDAELLEFQNQLIEVARGQSMLEA